MKFLDAAYYGSVTTWNQVMAQQGADDFAYYVGGDFALHAWNGVDVIALRTGSRRGMGIHVTSILGRNGAADGSYFAAYNKNAYGARDGDLFCLDVEPSVYDQDPAQVKTYSIAWAGAVRQVAMLAELAPSPPVPVHEVIAVTTDRVILGCGHTLLRFVVRERDIPRHGDRFLCHDCAMGAAA